VAILAGGNLDGQRPLFAAGELLLRSRAEEIVDVVDGDGGQNRPGGGDCGLGAGDGEVGPAGEVHGSGRAVAVEVAAGERLERVVACR